jgi:microcompartment protein CcmL/EutN
MPTDRDIRELRGVIDPRLGKILIELNGDVHALRQAMQSVASMMNQLADVMGKQQIVMQNFKPYIQQLKQMGMEVGSDPSITGEIDEPV